MLPAATVRPEGISLIDSLFTATSAVCVTGLIVQDTGSFFTPFGRWVILTLFQLGGLGIMTFSTLFAVLMGRKLNFVQADAVRSSLDHRSVIGFKRLLIYIVLMTLVIELAGAAALFFRWRSVTDWSFLRTAEQAVFHAVSGFCNAGFSLFSDSLMAFRSDPVVNLVMMGLIFAGGIGFVVLMDLAGVMRAPGGRKRPSLQTKTVLWVSAALIFAGASALFLFELPAARETLAWPARAWGAFFQSVTARTAGFNTMDIALLGTPSQLVLITLMFIGASPGSTGGGIKTTTFAVILAALWSMFTNRGHVTLFGRTVPRQVVREVFVIFFLSLAWVGAFTLFLTLFGGHGLGDSLFEVTSAFGTVGLSTGITPFMNELNKVLITVTMFVGRVGPLTLALALALREMKPDLKYAEESMMVG